MLPVWRENPAQFVPNWNSIGIPVTTPIAKLRPKMRIQKRAAVVPALGVGVPGAARRASDFITRMSSASPIVSWGNR